MNRSLLAEEVLHILSSKDDDSSAPLEVSDARVGLALIQLAAGKEVTALDLGDACQSTAEDAQRVMTRRMLSPTASHYAVLGVPRTASGSDIRENYRRLIALVHPDSRPKGLPVDSAIQVNLAYGVLSDPDARARYDASLLNADTSSSGVGAAQSRSSAGPAPTPSSAVSPGRFDGLVNALTARRSLVWMAALLMLPIVWVLATRSGTPAPTRLVEARPKLQLDEEASAVSERAASAGLVTSNATAPGRPSETQSPMALAASRSLTIESERKLLAGSGGERPVAAGTSSATNALTGAPESATAHVTPTLTRPRDTARDEAVALRPVLAEAPARGQGAGPGQAIPELLARLADAVESGSIDRLNGLLGERMPGRASVMADFESVFRATRKRELRYVRIDQQVQSRPQTFSGVAELGLTAPDGTTSTQRLFLSGAVERRGERVQLARWSSHPVQ